MELIDFHCSEDSKFQAYQIFGYDKNLILPNLSLVPRKKVNMLGSIYRCEQLFSKMRYTKSTLGS